MPLIARDFEQFDAQAVHGLLSSFDSRSRQKGENYFRRGAVLALECEEPGIRFFAIVQGTQRYEVALDYIEGGWLAECTCPVGIGCKHGYAALRHLLTQHSLLGSGAVRPAAAPSPPPDAPRTKIAAASARPVPTGFAAAVEEKLGRRLATDEARYVKNIQSLFNRARNGGLHFENDLTGLGIPQSVNWWQSIELYPGPPGKEADFWSFLALYLTEKKGLAVPEFLEPVTDLDKARAALRRHFHSREVERWRGILDQFNYRQEEGPAVTKAVELRVRFLKSQIMFEWRLADGGNWTELTPRKTRNFDVQYAHGLSAEAALLWLPFLQRMAAQYATGLDYLDSWVEAQASRWLRQPALRPLLVNEAGEPLQFHEQALRWQSAPPDDPRGDYAFSLVTADGQPAPEVFLVARGHPALYLTASGVFPGPPMEFCLQPGKKATLVPAEALETAGGFRLLTRLGVPLPPRLASRVRAITLQPCVRAEVKSPWYRGGTEFCSLQMLGASHDGEYIEAWTGAGWIQARSSPSQGKDNAFLQINRDGLAGLTAALDQTGFKWDDSQHGWQIRLTNKFPAAFVAFLKALPPGTRIDLRGELASFQDAQISGKIRLEASETEVDWFDLRVVVDVSDTTLTQEEIKLLLDAKGNWVRLGKKGWRRLEFALSEEEDRELARLGLTPHELTSEPQRLHAFQLADKAARKFLPEETCDRIERRASELQARVTPAVPAEIKAELRPYQREGFHFLSYLSANRFGGILADDMGLGKTLQTLAWLAWLRNGGSPAEGNSPGNRKPGLVVCPKSVADNWQAEAAKFYPELKVRVWQASELKSLPDQLDHADLHVLNYSQLRQAGDDLARALFGVVILDEGQFIKNPSSLTAQIARKLRSEHRLILSGTPIENRLMDLWSLMSFSMPGALGTRAQFGRLYDDKKDPFARQRLSARVRPFLIRRTKAQVARDLPDRMEEDLFCELEGEQKTLYRAELKRAQAMLLGVKTSAALNKQRFNFLTSLLRLRQICCHPRLVKPDSKAVSAKVEALMETLEPLLEEGQKVLVFSQFVELLDILRAELGERQVPHWYLAGATENRGDLVAQFQSASGPGVFLISLKAGGFGLNLTAASYVVLFDPWWNPAVENQAIDRTHRIGQERKVIAYRLLIKDSIEEKIRALQKQKSSLADDVLGEEKFSQSLSLDDLRYLLAG